MFLEIKGAAASRPMYTAVRCWRDAPIVQLELSAAGARVVTSREANSSSTLAH
jgi:hypothetical protein